MNHPTETLRLEPDALSRIRSYHERSKHRHERYAAGPDTLDWDAQPNPFRAFTGAPRIALPAPGRALAAPYPALFAPGAIATEPVNLNTLALLLELSLGLSAWKQSGPDRWAVRCNPSSGNLHPTEAYLLCVQVPGLDDGVYHYASREHALELRCRTAANTASPSAAGPAVHLALSSIHWREAWKYGERAFRYCQLDCGHAIGALRYAAAALGWSLQLNGAIASGQLASLLGLDRDDDFTGAEPEEAEVLLKLVPCVPGGMQIPDAVLPDTARGIWSGRANVLDAHPMYRWPVIDEVAKASRKPAAASMPDAMSSQRRHVDTLPPRAGVTDLPAATLIRQRRSAQLFERSAMLEQSRFFQLLDALLPRTGVPWDGDAEPHIHVLLFVHRVAGLTPGLYALPRSAAGERQLRSALFADFTWTHIDAADQLPLYLLKQQDLSGTARMLNCSQAIASDSAFAVAMLAEFDAVLQRAPWHYRALYREAGLAGQALYLEAEAAGVRGTGIGCFIDDDCHALLGLTDHSFQSLYHFTVGTPQIDTRIASLPPYPAPDADQRSIMQTRKPT